MLITEAMQIAVTPVFLLTGIGALLNVMFTTLGRIKDRQRILLAIKHKANAEDANVLATAINKLSQRSVLVTWSIWLASGSALFVCIVIIVLFAGAIVAIEFSTTIASLFIICMTMLATSLLLFVYEVFLATRSTHKNEDSCEVIVAKLK